MKQLNLNHRTRLTENARFWRTVINKRKGKRKGKGKERKREREGKGKEKGRKREREREGIRRVSRRHSPKKSGISTGTPPRAAEI